MPAGPAAPLEDPALVLSLLVGTFHACMYLVIRDRLGPHVLGVFVAAIAGAMAGQVLGARLGDVLHLGDYPILWASAMAWIGIVIVAVTSALVGGRDADDGSKPGVGGRRGRP